MTSELLIEKLKHIGVEEWRLAAEKIEKDLEVLEILKKYIDFINCHYIDGYYNEKGQTYIDILIPESDKNYAIIKEWLENEHKGTKNI